VEPRVTNQRAGTSAVVGLTVGLTSHVGLTVPQHRPIDEIARLTKGRVPTVQTDPESMAVSKIQASLETRSVAAIFPVVFERRAPLETGPNAVDFAENAKTDVTLGALVITIVVAVGVTPRVAGRGDGVADVRAAIVLHALVRESAFLTGPGEPYLCAETDVWHVFVNGVERHAAIAISTDIVVTFSIIEPGAIHPADPAGRVADQGQACKIVIAQHIVVPEGTEGLAHVVEAEQYRTTIFGILTGFATLCGTGWVTIVRIIGQGETRPAVVSYAGTLAFREYRGAITAKADGVSVLDLGAERAPWTVRVVRIDVANLVASELLTGAVSCKTDEVVRVDRLLGAPVSYVAADIDGLFTHTTLADPRQVATVDPFSFAHRDAIT
jgi:hypothetical protein